MHWRAGSIASGKYTKVHDVPPLQQISFARPSKLTDPIGGGFERYRDFATVGGKAKMTA